jgi:DNA polymerase elongation subunit (family B)
LNNKLYTNIYQRGNTFYIRGVEGDDRFEYKEIYKPTLYTSTLKQTDYKDVYGNNVSPVKLDNVSSAREFIKRYSKLDDITVYGMDSFEYQLIHDHFNYDLTELDRSKIEVYSIDIEVFSGINGPFPKPYDTVEQIDEFGIINTELEPLALYPIPMISIKTWNNKAFLFTATPYKHNVNHPDIGKLDLKVNLYDNEEDMLFGFLNWWNKNPPDIVTGWNSTSFDIPYIINRIKRLSTSTDYIDLNTVSNGKYDKCTYNPLFNKPNLERLLSPWGIVNEKQGEDKFKNKTKYYEIAGISLLDYWDIYLKFTFDTKTDYSLGAICNIELDTTKIKYNASSLNEFFITNVQKYTEYNIHDANLVHLLDNKKQFINIVYTLSYMSKCNYQDTFGTIKPWDALIYGMLNERNIVVPLNTKKDKVRYPGAFVKLPKAGKYGFTISLDLNSLYPHVYMQWNIGPETLLEGDRIPAELKKAITYSPRLEWVENVDGRCIIHGLDDLINRRENLDALKKYDICLAANGSFFRTDTKSIFSEKLEEIYAARKVTKQDMNKFLAFLEDNKHQLSNDNKVKLRTKSDMLYGKQMAYKIFMVSLYGATGSPYFRWYHNDIASAITISAQLANRWIMRKLNDLFNKILGTADYDYVIYGDTDSTDGDTVIVINKNHSSVNTPEMQVTISSLYESLLNDYIHKDDENHNWIKKCEGLNSLSLNSITNELEYKNINYVKKHRVYKEIFELTVGNKTVIITSDHSLIVKRNDIILEVKPNDVLDSDMFIELV